MSGGPVRSQGGGVESRVADLERKQASDSYVTKAGNLSDVADIPTARANLIPAGTLINSQLANMAQATVKGRAAAAGTGVPVDLTAAQLATLMGFTELVANDGYQKLPSGVIIQWGYSGTSTIDRVVTFPTTFPTAVFCVVATLDYKAAVPPSTQLISCITSNPLTTGFSAYPRFVNTGGGVGTSDRAVRYIAIGN